MNASINKEFISKEYHDQLVSDLKSIITKQNEKIELLERIMQAEKELEKLREKELRKIINDRLAPNPTGEI